MKNADVKFSLLCRLWADTTSISPEEMEVLVSSGVVTPDDMIIRAAMDGRDDLVHTLLKKGANPNKRGYRDDVPALFRAAEAYSGGATFATINQLMKAGANPHGFMDWYDMGREEYYYGTIAVVVFKTFGINILKVA